MPRHLISDAHECASVTAGGSVADPVVPSVPLVPRDGDEAPAVEEAMDVLPRGGSSGGNGGASRRSDSSNGSRPSKRRRSDKK
jgi:hypothetical protein